jgi:hypothetical protein
MSTLTVELRLAWWRGPLAIMLVRCARVAVALRLPRAADALVRMAVGLVCCRAAWRRG